MAARDFFRQRSYQRPSRAARRAGYRHFVKLWHRRAGKDADGMIFLMEESMKRIGSYGHVFPALNQGRRDVWNNTVQFRYDGKEEAKKLIDIFPAETIVRRDNAEMFVEFKWGSTYQIMGADTDEAIERLRGPNFIGILWSEYGHMRKKARDTILPMLAENGGWEMFGYTPNGQNHGFDLYNSALEDPENWWVSKLTIEDTSRDAHGEDGSRLVTQEEVDKLRRNGMREEWIQQEFYCSFTGFEHGTIYGDVLQRARAEGRITQLPYIVNLPVGVLFDLGHSDAIAMWFYQIQNGAIRFIDYHEEVQRDIRWAAQFLREQKPYMYGRIVLPWDGKDAQIYLESIGFHNVVVCERPTSVQVEIDQVRMWFPQFYFDGAKCNIGLDHLMKYRRKWDDENRIFEKNPVHDQHSHAADSIRSGTRGGFEPLFFVEAFSRPIEVITAFDPRSFGLPEGVHP